MSAVHIFMQQRFKTFIISLFDDCTSWKSFVVTKTLFFANRDMNPIRGVTTEADSVV